MTAASGTGQLEWEARAARPAAAAAFAAGLLPLIANFVLVGTLGEEGEGTARLLLAADESSGGVLAFGALSAVGILLLPVAVGYLLRVTRARREQVPAIAMPLLAGAALALAVVLLVQQILLVDVAGDFVAGQSRTEEAADELLEGSAVGTTTFLRFALNVALGVAVVLVAVNAMRAGLLSRFMGILGIAVGVFYAIPLLGGPALVQLFWLVALGLLFLGRWPGGRGPAWDRVEAVPWPSAAARAQAQREERVEEASVAGGGDAATAAEPDRPRPASRKRRRRR